MSRCGKKTFRSTSKEKNSSSFVCNKDSDPVTSNSTSSTDNDSEIGASKLNTFTAKDKKHIIKHTDKHCDHHDSNKSIKKETLAKRTKHWSGSKQKKGRTAQTKRRQ